MEFMDLYLQNIWQNPSNYYDGFSQAVLDSYWDDSTQVRTIKEQSYPFTDNYTEYECQVSTVSDFNTAVNKVSGDYISILFKDKNHTLNHKGQKYLYANDGESENYYLCYDKLQPLTQTPDFKAIRCNNHLTLLMEDGTIVKEPCSIGYEITSTNNAVAKDGTIPQRRIVCYIQGNESTKNIKLNQRFILQHRQAFKITEMNVLNQEDWNTEDVTMYTFYIEWCPILPTDNLELNIADYYLSNYSVKINSSDLKLVAGSTGTLTATVLLNGQTVNNIPLVWATSDFNVVSIDEHGNYEVGTLDGSTGLITCYIDNNINSKDTISVSIVSTPSTIKELIINPDSINRLLQGNSISISYGVYIGNDIQSDVVSISTSGADSSNYSISYGTNKIIVTNILKSQTPLNIEFISGALTKSISIPLSGIL